MDSLPSASAHRLSPFAGSMNMSYDSSNLTTPGANWGKGHGDDYKVSGVAYLAWVSRWCTCAPNTDRRTPCRRIYASLTECLAPLPPSAADIKWLGVRPSDLDRFNIPQQCRLAMTDEDIKTGKKLVRRAAVLGTLKGMLITVCLWKTG